MNTDLLAPIALLQLGHSIWGMFFRQGRPVMVETWFPNTWRMEAELEYRGRKIDRVPL